MEDPKAFSAPITALDDTSASRDEKPESAPQDVRFSSDVEDDGKKTSETTHVNKSEDSVQEIQSEKDIEKALEINNSTDLEANVSRSSNTSDAQQKREDETADPNVVDWDGPDDPQNPLNWPTWKIKTHIFLVSAITFIR